MPTPRLSPEKAQAAVDAYMRHGGSRRDAAASLGLPVGTLDHQLNRARELGLWDGRKPAPHIVQSQMAQVGGDPSRASHGWIITPQEDGGRVSTFWGRGKDTDDELREALEAKVAAYHERLPVYAAVPLPEYKWVEGGADLYPYFDSHIGAYAYHREGGARWDVDEAQRLIVGATALAMQEEPRPDRAIIVFGGDWRHYERPDAMTQYSGHILSSDTRIAKVQRIAVTIKVAVIDLALTHYRHVEVIDMEGNHDPVSPHADRAWLRLVYRNEPRLSVVDDNDLPIYATRVGKVFLGFHHGDLFPIKTKAARTSLALRFATERAEHWTAATALRSIHSGHLHHEMAGWCDESGVMWHQHGTMAPRDGRSARLFSESTRWVSRLRYHGEGGLVGILNVPPVLVKRMAAA
jgi:hypothetical protein